MSVAVLAEGWPYKVLDKNVHKRLVDGLEGIAVAAGVPLDMLDRNMADSGCSQGEIDWVRTYREQGEDPGGLLLCGKFKPAPLIRMQAIAAAFLRNYINARVTSLMGLLSAEGEFEMNPTVLLVHDFSRTSTTGGKAITNWQAQYVAGLIADRLSARRPSVLHVESMHGLKIDYGASFHDLLIDNWLVISA